MRQIYGPGIGALGAALGGMAGARPYNLKDLQNPTPGQVIRCTNPVEAVYNNALAGQASAYREYAASLRSRGMDSRSGVSFLDPPANKKLSIREKLQEEINEWLKEFK